MKIKNKILPIAALAATTSAITPIAISCGNSLSATKKEVVGLSVDIETLMKKGYARTINPSFMVSMDPTEATELYLNALDKFENLLAVDMFDYWGNINWSEQLMPLPTGSTGTITIGNVVVDKTNLTLSYAIKIDASIPTKIDPTKGDDFEFISNCDLLLEVNKVPVVCEYRGMIEHSSINLWLMYIDFLELDFSTTNWSINMTGTIDAVGGDTKAHSDIALTLNKDVDELNKMIELLGLSTYLQHPAFYFKNTKAVE